MKIALLFVLGVSASAQGWGRREAMRPWLQGTFSDAAQTFANMRGTLAGEPQPLLWQAEFEIERARFSDAAALINGARRIATYDLATLPERRLARLLLETGRFREAQTVALEGRQWDGRNIEKLKSYSPMALVTLGELAFLKGDFSVATSILEKARDKARSASSLGPRIHPIADLACALAFGGWFDADCFTGHLSGPQ